MISPRQIISSANLVFWDFDGVIKESVDVKTRAFEALFLPHGSNIATKVRLHHEANGGVSRFEKMPLYLTWAGIEPTESTVKVWCDRFSDMVLQAVVESPWVPGTLEYLEEHYQNQYFVLVTATPQSEIEIILHRLGIGHFFRSVFGSPISKIKAIGIVLDQMHLSSEDALMIGDAESDLIAAEKNQISFILRRTPINHSLQTRYRGPQLSNLSL
ncbi:HAD family hydrolase [Cylindrospermopsis raciborskii]|uniref:HAD family hydrolase n=1 Tax=Cylindrospermopsis raciborskii TaxID=77022 RepID=UPI002155C03B|nr:HAD hydrolase-like protein [Cylindrospermopsis raciborskii]